MSQGIHLFSTYPGLLRVPGSALRTENTKTEACLQSLRASRPCGRNKQTITILISTAVDL